MRAENRRKTFSVAWNMAGANSDQRDRGWGYGIAPLCPIKHATLQRWKHHLDLQLLPRSLQTHTQKKAKPK